MSNNRQKLDGISYLRLIATIGIMLYHIGFGHYYFDFIRPAASVHLFLCISAFLFMYTTKTRTAGYFIKNRLVRIVPLYAILTVLTFVAAKFVGSLFEGGADTSELIKSLLFIPYSRGSLKGGDVVRPLVGPAWTLYYDVWFAVVFACAMKISQKWRGLLASCGCILLFVLGKILPQGTALARYLDTIYWFDFIVGIGAFYAWNYLSKKTKPVLVVLGGIVSVLSLLALFLVPSKYYLHPLISFVLLISTLLVGTRMSAPKFVNGFSNLSYSFYLIHYYVIIAAGMVLNFKVLSVQTLIGTVVVFGVTLLASICSYKIIEVWLCNILKRWILKK